MNHKRTHRHYKAEGLQFKPRRPRRWRAVTMRQIDPVVSLKLGWRWGPLGPDACRAVLDLVALARHLLVRRSRRRTLSPQISPASPAIHSSF